MSVQEVQLSQVGAHFERRASGYEREALVHREAAHLLLEGLPTAFNPNAILEVGSHEGLLSRMWRKRFPDAKGVLLDIWPGFKDCCDTLKLSGVLADGERLPFGPETFDLILSGSTFQWYGNWEPSLKKTYQSIKPQGVLAFSQFCYPSLEPLKSISESLGRSQSFLPLMEYDEILGSLSKTFQGAPLKSQCLERCLYFDTPRSVFDHLRALGVTANGANHRPWTASQWRKACDALEKERVVEGIPLRYCIGLYWLMVL